MGRVAHALGEMLGCPRRMWTRASGEQRLWFFCAFALSIAALIPIWSNRLLPLLDEPNHLASVFVLANYHAPWANLTRFYELNLRPVPYLLHFGIGWLFAHVAGAEFGHKVALSCYVLAIPCAGWVWCKRTKRSPWLALLTFPLAYSTSWAFGFHPFNSGLAAMLLALAAFDAFWERGGWACGAAAAISSFACYFGHALALVILCLCVGVLWIAHRWSWQRLTASALIILGPIALWYWQWSTARLRKSLGPGPWLDGHFTSVWQSIRELPSRTLDTVKGDGDTAVFWVLAAVALVVGAHSVWLRRRAPDGPNRTFRQWLFDLRTVPVILVMAAGYFGLPANMSRPFDWWFVAGRFAPVMAFFLFLVPIHPMRGAIRWVMVPAVAAGLWLPLYVSNRYAEFNDRAWPFVHMIERALPMTNVLYAELGDPSDPAVNEKPYSQAPSWIQAIHGGFNPAGFTLVFDNGPYGRREVLPAPRACVPCFHPRFLVGYQHIILRNEPRDHLLLDPRTWRRAHKEGAFTMYDRAAPGVGN